MVKRRKTAGTPGAKQFEIKEERSPSGKVLMSRTERLSFVKDININFKLTRQELMKFH